jgi:hypothetical protein
VLAYPAQEKESKQKNSIEVEGKPYSVNHAEQVTWRNKGAVEPLLSLRNKTIKQTDLSH